MLEKIYPKMEISKDFDIIESLLNLDLTFLCSEIFCELDSKSLTNCRLTCHQWKNFIDQNFLALPRGKKWVKKQLMNNLLNQDYLPRVKVKDHKEELYGVMADKDGVCVSTKQGTLTYYDLELTTEIWDIKLSSEWIQHCMNSDNVFAVDSRSEMEPIFDGRSNVSVIDRKSGKLLHRISNNHPMYAIRTFKNILATGDITGIIRFYQIISLGECDGEDGKMLELFNTSKQTTNIAHLDNDNNNLVSGDEHGEIVAWDFKIGSKLGTVQSHQNINIIKVKWPLVITCSFVDRGIKIFNMENLSLVNYIDVHSASDVNIIKNVLIVAGEVYNRNSQVYTSLGHTFWNLTELIGAEKTDMEVIQKRKIDLFNKEPCLRQCGTMDAFQGCFWNFPNCDGTESHERSSTNLSAVYGSDVFMTENNALVKRSFWP